MNCILLTKSYKILQRLLRRLAVCRYTERSIKSYKRKAGDTKSLDDVGKKHSPASALTGASVQSGYSGLNLSAEGGLKLNGNEGFREGSCSETEGTTPSASEKVF